MKPGTKDCITEANFGKLKSGLKKVCISSEAFPFQICSANCEMSPEATPPCQTGSKRDRVRG